MKSRLMSDMAESNSWPLKQKTSVIVVVVVVVPNLGQQP